MKIARTQNCIMASVKICANKYLRMIAKYESCTKMLSSFLPESSELEDTKSFQQCLYYSVCEKQSYKRLLSEVTPQLDRAWMVYLWSFCWNKTFELSKWGEQQIILNLSYEVHLSAQFCSVAREFGRDGTDRWKLTIKESSALNLCLVRQLLIWCEYDSSSPWRTCEQDRSLACNSWNYNSEAGKRKIWRTLQCL